MICVYVPEGTALNKPFPDYATGKDNYTFYEPNQFVLGHGTWLEGWQIYQTNDILKVRDAGTVGISQVPDTSAGNNMRIRVPLSKKLNPGRSPVLPSHFWAVSLTGSHYFLL